MPRRPPSVPTLEYLRECFDYNPQTGELIWKSRPVHHFACVAHGDSFNTRMAGCPAGSVKKGRGYKRVELCGAQHYVHRICYAIHHSIEPSSLPVTVDHKDCDATNNRADNLRAATIAQNNFNQRTRRDNTSGYKGVTFHASKGKWAACIGFERKLHHLGYFPSAEEAYAAYCAASEGFHGDFARVA